MLPDQALLRLQPLHRSARVESFRVILPFFQHVCSGDALVAEPSESHAQQHTYRHVIHDQALGEFTLAHAAGAALASFAPLS